MAAPDLDKEMRVEADVLDYATEEVLSMKCKDKRWRPVAYISKLLSNTEKNYKIHDKEMLVVIRCLEAWRHFLEGVQIKFEVWTVMGVTKVRFDNYWGVSFYQRQG